MNLFNMHHVLLLCKANRNLISHYEALNLICFERSMLSGMVVLLLWNLQNNRNQQRDAESNGPDINTKYNDPVDKIFVLILAWGWFAGCVYYGHTSNNIPPFDYSAPIEAAIFRLKATWIYILAGGIGMYLIQYVAEKIYKR